MNHDTDAGRYEQQREVAQQKAGHGLHPLLHRRPVQRDQQQHHAGVARADLCRCGLIGASQYKHPFGLMGPGGPDFLAVDHPFTRVRIAAGPGTDAGQVGARAGLGVALSPIVGAGQNAWQEALFLLGRAKGHQRRGQQGLADMADTAWATAAHILLVEDDLLGQRDVAAAVPGLPAQAGPAALGQFLLPFLGQLRVIAFGAQAAGVAHHIADTHA